MKTKPKELKMNLVKIKLIRKNENIKHNSIKSLYKGRGLS